MFRRLVSIVALVITLAIPSAYALTGERELLLGGAQQFTPASLPGLIGWFKADAGVFSDTGCSVPATNSGSVGCWKDFSPGANNVTASSNQPTYATNSLNGLPTLVSGNTSNILLASAATVALGGNTISAFAVSKATSTASGRIIAFAVSGSDVCATCIIPLFYPSVTTAQGYWDGVSGSSATIVSGSWNELGSIFSGTQNIVYLGSVAQTPVSVTTTGFAATGNFSVFGRISPGQSFAGNIAEIIVTKGVLNANEIAAIHTYFKDKWGV